MTDDAFQHCINDANRLETQVAYDVNFIYNANDISQYRDKTIEQ